MIFVQCLLIFLSGITALQGVSGIRRHVWTTDHLSCGHWRNAKKQPVHKGCANKDLSGFPPNAKMNTCQRYHKDVQTLLNTGFSTGVISGVICMCDSDLCEVEFSKEEVKKPISDNEANLPLVPLVPTTTPLPPPITQPTTKPTKATKPPKKKVLVETPKPDEHGDNTGGDEHGAPSLYLAPTEVFLTVFLNFYTLWPGSEQWN